jgi:putative Ca2+/H+ antiporter (TMEM165/GDT1 family)
MKRAGGFLGDFEPYDPSTYTGAALESQQDEKNPFAPGAEPAAEDWLNNSSSVSRRSRNYGYGSTIAAFSMERSEESDLTLLLAFAIPLVSIFLVESGDKSIGLLIDRLTSTNKSHGLLTVSAVLFAGYLPAISFACFIGFFMERQLSESRLLIVTTAGTCALALVACSAAF